MKNILSMAVIVVLSLFGHSLAAQENTVTLSEALHQAEIHYPLIKQKQLLDESGRESKKLLNASLYPQVNVTGAATYQSEVTELEAPGFPSGFGQKPSNYDVGLEMRLPLTHFGRVQTRKELEEAQMQTSIAQVDVEMQKVRERITSLFGNLLLQKENENILRVRISDLDSQARKVSVGVSSGAVLKSNQLVLESEILSTQQRIEDIRATEKSLIKQLSLLTGMQIDSTTRLQLSDSAASERPVNRPELKAFAGQQQVLQLQKELIKKEARPDLYAFGQGNYGRPGYNFLNTQPRTYGIAGLGLSWNLNSLFNQSKEQKLVDYKKQLLSQQQETFSLNLQAALEEKAAEIEKYGAIISKDDQIVRNRQEIIRAAASQLENGVITSTEYLTELNAQNTAQLNLTLHRVQLAMARSQYNILLGY